MKMTEEGKKVFDADELLKILLEDHKVYFTDDRYRKPTSRYEAWLMASCLSNLIIARTLEKAFLEFKRLLDSVDIFQKQPDLPIIKEEKNQKIEEEKKDRETRKTGSILRRRKRED